MEKMYRCARGLCWKIMILQRNKWATFNFVMISSLIFMTQERVLIEQPSYYPEGPVGDPQRQQRSSDRCSEESLVMCTLIQVHCLFKPGKCGNTAFNDIRRYSDRPIAGVYYTLSHIPSHGWDIFVPLLGVVLFCKWRLATKCAKYKSRI
jgi:hypothetical protein